MIQFDLLEIEHWQPLAWLGLTSKFFTVNFETVLHTWMVMILLFISIIGIRYILQHKKSPVRYAIMSVMMFLVQIVEQTIGYFSFAHFSFIGTLFIFIALCNTATLIPWLDEPTKDINTTLAFGSIAFLYVQACAIGAHGIREYTAEFFKPIFIMFPLHVISKLAMIISISFRLFGNIFGGAIIGGLYLSLIKGSLIFETIGLLSGFNFVIALFFGLFEGVLQAFIFTVLTITYISIAMAHEEEA